MLVCVFVTSAKELKCMNFLMLQFTIKPLDKKKDVFKFYSSQLRVNKLVGYVFVHVHVQQDVIENKKITCLYCLCLIDFAVVHR